MKWVWYSICIVLTVVGIRIALYAIPHGLVILLTAEGITHDFNVFSGVYMMVLGTIIAVAAVFAGFLSVVVARETCWDKL